MLKKLFLVSFTLLALCPSNSVLAQRSYTFNATTLNVDGLPNKIAGITINKDGKEAAGATAIGNETRAKGWDIVAMSEDFNFHDYLIAPIANLYSVGTHGGKVSSLSNATDGLGLLLTKKTGWSFSNETRVKWNDHYGFTDHGADGLINKGFRYYTITIAPGVEIDFYCLHMDAEDGEGDIKARASQLTQLATYIKSHDNGRPVLILGDTNCRYTRDDVKGKLIDPINAVDNLTIHDAWIELIRGGVYPKLGDPSIMIGDEGPQRGEVVDKIFWIENSKSRLKIQANSFLHDTSFTASDHYPLTVCFTVTDPTAAPATQTDYTLPETATATVPEIAGNSAGEVALSGETFFLMNLATKKYLQAGANWGTHAVEDVSAMPLTLTLVDGQYRINTIQGSVSAEADPYMDNQQNTTWTFEPVAGEEHQYIIKCATGALASVGTDNLVKALPYDVNDNRQKWAILTEAKLKEVMKQQASSTSPFNITPLVKGASFGCMDGWNNTATGKSYAANWWEFSCDPSYGGVREDNSSTYRWCAALINTGNITMTQTINNLPKGTYAASAEAFYRSRAYAVGGTKDHKVKSTFSFAGQQTDIKQNTNVGMDASKAEEGPTKASEVFKDNDDYKLTLKATLNEGDNATIKLYKEKCNGLTNKSGMLAVDNMELYYFGDNDDTNVDPYITFKNAVAKHVNNTWEKVKQLNEAGQKVYDISTVIYRYNSNTITTQADVEVLCEWVDKAYQRALIASLNNEPSGDMTALIINPSFETGDMTGWSSGTGNDVNVKPNSDATYTVQGCDGNYLFNSYNGDNETSAPYIHQTISGVKNGLYEVRAWLTSFAGRSAFLIGNHAHKGIVADDKGQMKEAVLQFLVEDGNLTVGAVGGSGDHYDLFMPMAGGIFKADNFSLRYVTDLANGRIKLALDEAKQQAANFTDHAGDNLNTQLAEYTQGVEAGSYTGDGRAEAKAIYALLCEAAKQQRSQDADMTFAIVNPNFELGDMTGWSCATEGWETKVVLHDNATYTTLGTEGSYLFNTWNGTNAVKPLTQTVDGLPNGKYRVSAMVAMDAGNDISLTVNHQTTTTAAVGAGTMALVMGEFDVTDHKADIALGNDKGQWFKADNFRMTFLGNELTMDETAQETSVLSDYYTTITVNRTIKDNGKWSTLVLPFNMTIPEGWEVKELTDDTHVDANGNINLRFATAKSIEAGKPYMVRVNEAVSQIVAKNVDVDMKAPVQNGNGINFVGVYTAGYIPTGAFFISNNQFNHATGSQNIIKGMRAYLLLPEGSEAKTVTFDISDTPTSIKTATTAAPVAIYDLQGNRLSRMAKGVNIIKQANGSVTKVIIK